MIGTIFDPDVILPMFIFSIPIIAITGGIVIAIVRALGRQRMIELAQRERIAAIERGIDPEKLPALHLALGDPNWGDGFDRPGSGALRQAQGLLIGGIVTTFTGLGLIAFFAMLLHDEGKPVWAIGLIPTFIGFGLLISARLVWPRESGAPRA